MSSYGTRVLNTEDLITLGRRAKNLRLSRYIGESHIKLLDPEGNHVMWIATFGHNMDAHPDTLVHRVRVLAKVEHDDQPVELDFDIRDEDFQRLTKVEDVQSQIKRLKAGETV